MPDRSRTSSTRVARWVSGVVAAVLASFGSAPSAAHAEPAASAPSTAAPAPAAATAPATKGTASPAPLLPASATRARQAEAIRKLSAPDPEAVKLGIQTLRELGDAASQKALTTRVQAGLPPALIVVALDALVATKAKRALPVIVELAQHRRALVRSSALTALGALEQRGARATQAILLAALEDASSDVSAAAAGALTKVGTPAALPALFAAYDRGVTSALPAIAQLAGRESVGALIERMPQGVVEPVEPALDKLLEGSKLSTADQVELARKLKGLGTDSARRYLLKWLERIKLNGQARVKGELFEALKAMDAAAAAPQPKPQATPTVAAKGATP